MAAAKSLKASWKQALVAFLFPVLLVLGFRWLLIEPYVIPSESMVSTLLVHDHIMVNKLAYGIRVPFSKTWLVRWSFPKRGEIIVFHYPRDPEIFFVKRVIGVPGDKIEVRGDRAYVNGREEARTFEHEFPPIDETAEATHFEVGEDELFVMGDNRNNSSDSRVWGTVPISSVLGRASIIWLSCDDVLPSAPYICDPQKLRFSRILTFVH